MKKGTGLGHEDGIGSRLCHFWLLGLGQTTSSQALPNATCERFKWLSSNPSPSMSGPTLYHEKITHIKDYFIHLSGRAQQHTLNLLPGHQFHLLQEHILIPSGKLCTHWTVTPPSLSLLTSILPPVPISLSISGVTHKSHTFVLFYVAYFT